jgi:pimeloyl-ACP methyl ester carboxylesterase
MVEHRGVGLSRRSDSGADLRTEALTISGVVEDVAAVLDDAGVERATVYGASYGSYLAAGVGIRHPGRVSAMVLDSPLLGSADIEYVRRNVREVLWDDDSELASKVRRLVEAATLTPTDLTIAGAIYGVGGPDLLERHLDLLLARRRAMWTAIRGIAIYGGRRMTPFHNEPDLVGAIGFRELNFAGTPDGLPLDPALTWREVPGSDIPFEGEPFDLVAEMPRFRWPTVIISGGRDLVTPPVVAARIAELGLPAWLLLIDMSKAYDSVARPWLRASMVRMGFREAGAVRWCRILLDGSTCRVRLNGAFTLAFPVFRYFKIQSFLLFHIIPP